MQEIRVTFPIEIAKIDVQYGIVAGLNVGGGGLCSVTFMGENKDGENSYSIHAETAQQFYQIGMLASAILIHYTKNAEHVS